MFKKAVLSLAVASILGFAGQSHASTTNQIEASGFTLSVGYIGYHLHYKEDLSKSDKDTAWMNGLKIKIQYVSSEKGPLGHPYKWLTLMYAQSKNGSYNGYGQNGRGNYIPFSTDTTEKIARIKSGLGYIQTRKSFATKESLLMGWQLWIRKIHSGIASKNTFVQGYKEYYYNLYFGLKLEGDYYFTKHFYIGLALSGAISPKVKFMNFMYNDYTDKAYKMGIAYRWKIALPINFHTGRLSFNIIPFYSGWKFHKSGTKIVKINGIYYNTYEPSSTTHETGVYANVSFRF